VELREEVLTEEDVVLRDELLTEEDVVLRDELLEDELRRDDEELVLRRVEELETVEEVDVDIVVYGGRDTCLL
jgi:hypothetical protein